MTSRLTLCNQVVDRRGIRAQRGRKVLRLDGSHAFAPASLFVLLPEQSLDIRLFAFLDHLDHDWLVEHIATDKGRLRAWLKAGFMDQERYHPTIEGTPQGGIISPTVANVALDGLEACLKMRFKPCHKIHAMRYADDFVITGCSRMLLQDEVKPLVVQFLAERGLELAEEKTRIVHIEQGFDFLGFNIRKYNGKLLIRPAKSSIAAVKEKVRGILKVSCSAVFGTGVSL